MSTIFFSNFKMSGWRLKNVVNFVKVNTLSMDPELCKIIMTTFLQELKALHQL